MPVAVSTNVDISDDESGMAKGNLFKPRVEATKQMTQNWTFRGPRISESANIASKGDGQNTDPQSMDYPNGLPKWTTSKNTISEYILTLHDLHGLQPPF